MESRENQGVDFFDASAASIVELINELNEIRGYKGSAITTDDGELLYSDTTGLVGNSDLGGLVKVYSGLFGHLCSLSEKSGFVSCTEVALQSGKEVVVIRCSGKDCLVGIRLFVLIDIQGNVPITQRRLGKLLPQLMQCLTWDPDNLVPLYMREAALRQRNVMVS